MVVAYAQMSAVRGLDYDLVLFEAQLGEPLLGILIFLPFFLVFWDKAGT